MIKIIGTHNFRLFGNGWTENVYRPFLKCLIILICIFYPVVLSSSVLAVSAFPGAEGFGADTPGGRGGRIIEVTNLNDSGLGSFRQAVTTTGPRIIVFRVGGTIQLLSTINLDVSHSYLTIAGQTAPGGGIALRAPEAFGTILKFNGTHDIIIRYMRFRSGSLTDISRAAGRETFSSISEGIRNSIIDHNSFSWGVDETVGFAGDVRNITISWNIISEGLHCAGHSDGCHSNGLLLSGKDGLLKNSGNISLHHNLFAHNWRRSPRNSSAGLMDAVNNVVYNYNWAMHFQDELTASTEGNAPHIPNNIVKNYFKAGPNGGNGSADWEVQAQFFPGGKGFSIYLLDNIGPHRPSNTEPQDKILPTTLKQYLVGNRHSAPAITETSAQQAYIDVLNNAGALLPVRDSVDARIVNDVGSGTGGWIDNETQVGGFPVLDTGTPYADIDHDGMADYWETERFGTLERGSSSSSTSDYDSDGYTDLEEFLNSTNPSDGMTISPTPPPTGTNVCALKSAGDADCNGKRDLADFEIWRREYLDGCDRSTLGKCGSDDDNDGLAIDANFDFAVNNSVSLSDFEIWRKGYLSI